MNILTKSLGNEVYMLITEVTEDSSGWLVQRLKRTKEKWGTRMSNAYAAKEMKLSEILKDVQVENELYRFAEDMGADIFGIQDFLINKMYDYAAIGETKITISLMNMAYPLWEFLRKWLKDEGFEIIEHKDYGGDLKNIVTRVSIRWANAKKEKQKTNTASSCGTSGIATVCNDVAYTIGSPLLVSGVTAVSAFECDGKVTTTDCSLSAKVAGAMA